MIILDEEHEDSYQSENPPRYHARDVAKFLCAQHGAMLLLGSATPSVESTWQAQRGAYQKLILRSRYNRQPLPRVLIADLREEVRSGNTGTISAPLREELAENLLPGGAEHPLSQPPGQQPDAVVRGVRGGAGVPPVQCGTLTYHSANGRLMCHYCGHSERARERCDECGGLMKHVGAGYPEGGGGAPPALPGGGGPPHGRRHCLRQPRGPAPSVRDKEDPHSPGYPDGGQGVGFRERDPGGGPGGGPEPLHGQLPGRREDLQPA